MTKIDIKETEGGGNPVSDKSNPEMIDNKMSDKNREGVSNESGYFEDDDESGAGLNQEDRIVDKVAEKGPFVRSDSG